MVATASPATFVASPGKPESRNAKIQSILQKLPQPPPTGNAERDSDLVAKHTLLLKMIDGCIADYSFVLPLFTAYQEHERNIAEDQKTSASYEERFTQATVFGRLDEGFAIKFLTTVSDMSAADISAAVRHNTDSIAELLEYTSQVPPQLRLLDELKVIEVCRRFLYKRSLDMQKPLKDFKAKGGVLASGGLNWKYGAYTLRFDQTKLVEITFRNGDKAAVPADSGITNDYKLIRNYSDYRAALEKKPFPEIKLALFFERGMGPYHFPKPFSVRCKEYPALVAEMYASWEDDRAKAGTGNHKEEVAVAEAKETISRDRNAKRKEQLDAARAKAQAVMKAKRAKSSISLKE